MCVCQHFKVDYIMQIVDIRQELIGTLLYCYYVSLRSEFLVVMSGEGACIIYAICVCLCIVVSYTMLPVSLDYLFLIAPSVFSNVYLSCVLCTLCCQFLWIIFSWLPLRLVYTMLPVSLDYLFLIAPSVFYNVNYLHISYIDWTQCNCTVIS